VQAKILNVDDHPAGRYARSRFLASAGFSVIEASNGADALRLVTTEKPDLVLLDINMPDMTGLDVCKEIRSNPETARVPVIFLTASRLADPDVVSGFDVGGDNYLREPVEPTVLVATIRSLLRARSAEEALVRSNEQLRRFAFVVSHELQEPLRMVKSYTQLLASRYEGRLDREADEFITYAVQGVSRMEKFIRDMLSYAQAAEGGIEMKPVACISIVDWALLELELSIRESGAQITHDELPVVLADSMRLSQVFKNLIGNAIKYHGEQPPRVHISCSAHADMWQISIADNGIGIDPKYVDSVFGLFKRLHGRDKAGSGVGLAICKEIVEHHGGRIWVDSEPGKGSTFHFTVPKVTAEQKASA
jgi:signal transduction histidine kinase